MSTPQPAHQWTEVNENLIKWVRAHELEQPVWILLELIRPFGWILGQACLVAQPLARGFGWEELLVDTVHHLENPERLTTLSQALAPNREGL